MGRQAGRSEGGIQVRAAVFLFFFASLVLWVPPVRAAEELPPPKEVIIPRLEIGSGAVKIDGKLTEEIWKKGLLAKGFTLNIDPEKRASQQTEVRIFYNRHYLWMGFTFMEAAMDRLVAGIPQGQTVDAPINSNGDAAEIFIDLDDDPLQYLQLRFNPRGGKNDNITTNRLPEGKCFNIDQRWNGDWEVATSVADDRWFAEVRFSLSTFAPEGVYSGTPIPGTAWRMNICRAEAPHGEFSTWTPLKGLFHQPKRFRRVIFGGWKPGEIIVTDADPGECAIGKNTFSATIENRAKRKADLKVIASLSEHKDSDFIAQPRDCIRWNLVRRRSTIGELAFSLDPGGKREIAFDYEVAFGGPKRVGLRINWESMIHPVHAGEARFVTYPLNAHLKRTGEELAALRKGLSETKLPRNEPAVGELSACIAECEAERKALQSSTDPYKKRIERCKELLARVARARLLYHNKIRPAEWGRQLGIKRCGFVVGLEHPTRKVFRDGPFAGRFTRTARMKLAKGEFESLQFVILPLADDVGEITVKTSTLKHASKPDKIIITHFQRTHHVGYIDVGDTGRGTRVGCWPDPLYPSRRIPVKPNRVQPVMYTLQSRGWHQSGKYTGKITFESASYGAFEIDLEVEVWPFALPYRKTLRTNIWFWQARPLWYYSTPWQREFTPAFFEVFAELLGRYNIPPSIRAGVVSRKLRLLREADGKVRFDFSRVDPFWEICVKNNVTVLNADKIGPGYFSAKAKYNYARILDPKTGEEKRYIADDPEATSDAYLVALCNHFKEKKWFGLAVFIGADEPWGAKGQQVLRTLYGRVKKLVPDLPRTSAGTVRKRMGLDGYLDIWCPQLRQYEAGDYEGSKEGLWFYQCLYKPGFPMFQIDRPGIEPRVNFWVCWKLGATGFLYWTSTAWDSDRMRSRKLGGDFGMARWVNEHWEFPMPLTPGDGCFIYPRPSGPIPTFRLQAMRDGIDDYEYLVVLRRAVQAAEKSGKADKALLAEARALLALPGDVVTGVTEWTKSIDRLEEMRERIAEMIIALNVALKKTDD